MAGLATPTCSPRRACSRAIREGVPRPRPTAVNALPSFPRVMRLRLYGWHPPHGGGKSGKVSSARSTNLPGRLWGADAWRSERPRRSPQVPLPAPSRDLCDLPLGLGDVTDCDLLRKNQIF